MSSIGRLRYRLFGRHVHHLIYGVLPSRISLRLLRAWCLLHGGHRFEWWYWTNMCRYCAAEKGGAS